MTNKILAGDAFEADSSFDGVEERSFDDFFSQQDNFFGDEFIPSAQPLGNLVYINQ